MFPTYECMTKITIPTLLFNTLPILSIVISLASFWVVWVLEFLDALDAVDTSVMIKESIYFALQFSFLLMPVFSTFFISVLIEWFRCCYVTSYRLMHSLSTDELSNVFELVNLIAECFKQASNTFLTYILTTNTVVITVSSVFCRSKLFSGIELIFYVLPLLTNAILLWSVCYRASDLIDEVS